MAVKDQFTIKYTIESPTRRDLTGIGVGERQVQKRFLSGSHQSPSNKWEITDIKFLEDDRKTPFKVSVRPLNSKAKDATVILRNRTQASNKLSSEQGSQFRKYFKSTRGHGEPQINRHSGRQLLPPVFTSFVRGDVIGKFNKFVPLV